jgi:hypothetical protein
MTYKMLFRVAYILFAIAQIPASIYNTSNFITNITYSLNLETGISTVLMTVASLFVSIGLIYLLVQFMEPIMRFFKIDKTFGEERFELNGNLKNIPMLFAISYGLYLIISPLPFILYYGYDKIIALNDPLNHVAQQEGNIILMEFIHVIIGFGLLAFSRPFANWVVRLLKNEEEISVE